MAGGTQSVLVFEAGEAWYAVPARNAAEVVTYAGLTPLPGARPHVLGVLAHRGEVIPIVDLGLLLGDPPVSSQRAVLVRTARGAFGLLASRIAGVEDVEAGTAPLGPGGLASVLREPVEVQGQQVTVIDVDGLLALLSEGR